MNIPRTLIPLSILCVDSETQFFGMLNKQCFATAFSQLSGALGVHIFTMDFMKAQPADSTLSDISDFVSPRSTNIPGIQVLESLLT
jgi:hypothetical protein